MRRRAWAFALLLAPVAASAWTATKLVNAEIFGSPPAVTGTTVVATAVAGDVGRTWVLFERTVLTGACDPGTVERSNSCLHELWLKQWPPPVAPAVGLTLVASAAQAFNPSIAVGSYTDGAGASHRLLFVSHQGSVIPACPAVGDNKLLGMDLREFDATAAGDPTFVGVWTQQPDASGACRDTGHTVVAWDPVHFAATACATTKSATEGDVACKVRTVYPTPATSSLSLASGAHDQDHAWLAFSAAGGNRRAAWHDGFDQESYLEMAEAPPPARSTNSGRR